MKNNITTCGNFNVVNVFSPSVYEKRFTPKCSTKEHSVVKINNINYQRTYLNK